MAIEEKLKDDLWQSMSDARFDIYQLQDIISDETDESKFKLLAARWIFVKVGIERMMEEINGKENIQVESDE